MRLNKNKPYNQCLIHLFFLTLVSCNSQLNNKIDQLSQSERDSTCVENTIIVTPKEKIKELLDNVFAEKEFYVVGGNEYYAFDIYLDSALVIQDTDIVFANNEEIGVRISKLFDNLDYKIFKGIDECKFSVIRFTIKARTKKILYPDSENYYSSLLPME